MQEQSISMGLFWTTEVSADFDALVREHGRILFKIAYSVLRNVEDAEDCVQESFLRALRSGEIKSIQDPRAWLARITWRVAIDRGKRRRGQDEQFSAVEDKLVFQSTGADDQVVQQQQVTLLHRMIASLPEELRVVIILSTVEELPSPEIANILGIPEGTVRTRQMKARQLLKEKLKPFLQGVQP
jgi:RNA polymerase sigma-70 factor (ECF subfamily)